MKILSGLTLFFYTLVFLAIGGILIAVSLNFVTQEMLVSAVTDICQSTNAMLIAGLAGTLLVLISIMVVQIAVGRIHREKTIAFENPDGQVTISLSAIEDFIKRALKQLPEVKELRPNVKAGKKGIMITSRVTLYSDINIPETTEKIQNIVKSRVQDMLGVEEPVTIRVHVTKISHKEDAPKAQKTETKDAQYRGSIEY